MTPAERPPSPPDTSHGMHLVALSASNAKLELLAEVDRLRGLVVALWTGGQEVVTRLQDMRTTMRVYEAIERERDGWMRRALGAEHDVERAAHEATEQAARALAEPLAAVARFCNCGDASCPFAEGTGGMRTNGGCMCAPRPFAMPALASLVQAARRIRSQAGGGG